MVIGFDPVTIEEIIDDEKPENSPGAAKSHKKKRQRSDNGGSDHSQKQLVVKSSVIPILESEDEDGFPVSTPSEKKNSVKKENSEDKLDKTLTGDGKTKDDDSGGACLKRKVDAIKDGECDRFEFAHELSVFNMKNKGLMLFVSTS